MAVRSRDELMGIIRTIYEGNDSDEAIQTIEDFSDTFADYESRSGEDWKAKYEENDASWRKRYKERFYDTGENHDHEGETQQQMEEQAEGTAELKTSYDELFTTE